jgi:Ni/Fe-hydrogenase subunit HybB-like protein
VFFVLVGLGLVLTVVRYVGGLGAVSNLSDRYPWGLWKAFNVLCGVGLGGAGFTLMGLVYVANLKRFRPIVRPAVLMAFLAYSSAAFALVIDIGRSWAIWHPLVMWNPHSVLFEVAWCLMLYTTVLLLEGSGMIFEKFGKQKLLRIQRAVTMPVVVAGILLSTLHQSSLGSLFLIVPGKLHALWYSPILPALFFVSALCVGLAMLIVMSHISARAFGHEFRLPLLRGLGEILVAFLGVYGVTRVFDLAARGSLGLVFAGGYEASMFQLELMIGVVLPFLLLVWPRARASARGLYIASLLVVGGFVLNRLNVSLTGFEGAQGGHYIPSWSEVFITLMVVALAFGAFGVAARYLPVFPDAKPATPAPQPMARLPYRPETAASRFGSLPNRG